MLKTLRETEPIVARVFEEADRTMEPLLGKTPDRDASISMNPTKPRLPQLKTT